MSFFRDKKRQRELDEEIEAHFALDIQQRIDRGETPEEARANASRQFGNVALVKEVTRESWRSRALDRAAHDLNHVVSHTWSTFRREPGIALVTVLTLTLVMGANTIMFSSVNALMLQNRPGAKHTDRLVDFVHISADGAEDPAFSYPNYRDYRDNNTVFSGLAAYSGNEPTGMRQPNSGTEIVRMAAVSGNYFEVLEVRPEAGRLLNSEDDRPGALPAAVISYRLWQQRFGRETAVIGSPIVLQGRPFTIVGVAAEAFKSTAVDYDDVWIPLAKHQGEWLLEERRARWLGVVGRLKPSTSLKQARAALALLAFNLQRHPRNKGQGMRLVNHWYQGLEPEEAMKGLTGMSLVVLLVACANIAGIGLSRALTRRPEIAVRLALGAPRRRVAFQLLCETIALFAPAGLAGLAIASSLSWTAILQRYCTRCVPELDIAPDWRVVLAVMGLMLGAAVVSTVAPALQAMRTDLTTSLKNKSTGGSPRRLRLQGVLIALQVGAAATLLIVGALYFRSLREIASTRAFDPQNVNVASIQFEIGGLSRNEADAFVAEALKRFAALPGMVAFSAARDVPQNDEGAMMPQAKLWRTGEEILPDKPHLVSELNAVSPGYFETLRIPVLRGRDFRPTDARAKPIAIISESVEKKLWPAGNAVGRRIYVCADTAKCGVEIVGVAADAVRGKPAPVVYRPLEQAYASWVYLLFRGLDSTQATPSVRKTLADINPNLPIISTLQMNDILHSTFFYHYVIVWSAGLLGLIAASMACLGIYGITSYGVASRMREIGIRTALGARPVTVIQTIIRRSMVLTAIGLTMGCAIALFVARAVPAINLYRVDDADPAAYGVACGGILLVAFVASYVPARRAAHADPMIVLRHE